MENLRRCRFAPSVSLLAEENHTRRTSALPASGYRRARESRESFEPAHVDSLLCCQSSSLPSPFQVWCAPCCLVCIAQGCCLLLPRPGLYPKNLQPGQVSQSLRALDFDATCHSCRTFALVQWDSHNRGHTPTFERR